MPFLLPSRSNCDLRHATPLFWLSNVKSAFVAPLRSSLQMTYMWAIGCTVALFRPTTLYFVLYMLRVKYNKCG